MMGLDFKVDVILNGYARICKLLLETLRPKPVCLRRKHYLAKFT